MIILAVKTDDTFIYVHVKSVDWCHRTLLRMSSIVLTSKQQKWLNTSLAESNINLLSPISRTQTTTQHEQTKALNRHNMTYLSIVQCLKMLFFMKFRRIFDSEI